MKWQSFNWNVKFCMTYCKCCFFISLHNKYLLDQGKMRLISRLIKGISIVLQKLLKYFNGTIISTPFLPLFLMLFFSLNLVELVYCPASLLIFDIPLKYYYFNIRSSIIFCLSSGDICFSLGISLSWSYLTISRLFSSAFSKPLQFY